MGFTFFLTTVGTKILLPGSWYQDLGTKIFGGTGPWVTGEPPSRLTLTQSGASAEGPKVKKKGSQKMKNRFSTTPAGIDIGVYKNRKNPFDRL